MYVRILEGAQDRSSIYNKGAYLRAMRPAHPDRTMGPMSWAFESEDGGVGSAAQQPSPAGKPADLSGEDTVTIHTWPQPFCLPGKGINADPIHGQEDAASLHLAVLPSN